VLENERVRVIEFALEPGVAMGVHDHPRDRVEITLAGGRVRVTTADGQTQEVVEEPGVVWSQGSAQRHDVVNIGRSVLRAYHVELK
jgi:quercetin dioxygenase-like cupin family protein